MEILEKAQRCVEHSTLDLSGNQDFIPFVIVVDEEDRDCFVGFTSMPEDDEAKDVLADLITALCVVHGAVQAAFGSAAWAAATTLDDDSDLPPSKRANRQEVAVTTAATAAGISGIRVASLVRENNKVGVGLWEQYPPEAASGRFAEALHLGLKLSKRIPPSIRAFLREQIEAGLEEEVLRSTAGVISEARRKGLTLEEGGWGK